MTPFFSLILAFALQFVPAAGDCAAVAVLFQAEAQANCTSGCEGGYAKCAMGNGKNMKECAADRSRCYDKCKASGRKAAGLIGPAARQVIPRQAESLRRIPPEAVSL